MCADKNYLFDNTLCIYDFDDTLFPSTLFARLVMSKKNNGNNSNNMGDETIEINEELAIEFGKTYDKELRTLELSIISILTQSIKYFGANNVYIVTNATLDWIRAILTTLIPETLPIFSQIQIISARVLSSPFYPSNQLMWKIHTFHQLTLYSFNLKCNLPDQDMINYHAMKLPTWNVDFYASSFACYKDENEANANGNINKNDDLDPKQAPNNNDNNANNITENDDIDDNAELSESNTSRSTSLSSLQSEIEIEEDQDQEEEKMQQQYEIETIENISNNNNNNNNADKPKNSANVHAKQKNGQIYRMISIGDSESERLACKCITNAIICDDQNNNNSIYQCVKFIKHPHFINIMQQLYCLENNLFFIANSNHNIDVPSDFLFKQK